MAWFPAIFDSLPSLVSCLQLGFNPAHVQLDSHSYATTGAWVGPSGPPVMVCRLDYLPRQ